MHINISRLVLLAVLFSLLILPETTLAHKVMIFGWVEGDTVHTISKFNGGKRVQHAPVTVMDTNGSLILTGKTDTEGNFTFKRPENKELNIVLEASLGHKTSCILKTSPNDENNVHTKDLQTIPDHVKPCKEDVLLANVEKTMDKKMAVLLLKIQDLQEKQRVSDIIGGMGYIFGIVGITMWFRRR